MIDAPLREPVRFLVFSASLRSGSLNTRLAGRAAAKKALADVAPVGEESEYITRALRLVGRYVDEPTVPIVA